MSDDLIELCPICIENPATYFTECNHGYCIGCLCRIKKCAMCRNPLQRSKICIQIKEKVKLINSESESVRVIYTNNRMTDIDFGRRVQTTVSRNGDLSTRMYLNINLQERSRLSEREDSYFNTATPIPTNYTNEDINALVSFVLNSEEWQPSHTTLPWSRVDNVLSSTPLNITNSQPSGTLNWSRIYNP